MRTTPEKVKAILGSNSVAAKDVLPFIETATIIVDRVNSKDTDNLLTDAALEKIECYLSAHFYGHEDQFRQSKNTGAAGASFQGQTAMMFQGSQYGQTAMILDFTGELAKLQQQATSGKAKAGASWLGTRFDNDNSERVSDQ